LLVDYENSFLQKNSNLSLIWFWFSLSDEGMART